MNNRAFIDQMAKKLGSDADELQQQVDVFVYTLLSQVKAGNSITVKNFGVFEQKTKAERKIYNPTTKTYNVIPAKETVAFKMGAALKEKMQ
ncbi:MAG: HU family DNA-binding protein [Bacteroidaceae bacterium]|nr:HU family DNA-binding protein [Bacteroidaceae bacterium]MBP5523159.1 HU family DNA-binding protein [Bacteroidaceae bacterium]